MKNFRNLVRESRVEDTGFSSVAAATLKYKQNKNQISTQQKIVNFNTA